MKWIGTVASALLATIGLSSYAQWLQAQGVPRTQMDEALGALNALLDPNTPDPTTLDPTIAQQLVAGYDLIYIASFERVLLIIAAVCFVGAAVVSAGRRVDLAHLTHARDMVALAREYGVVAE